MIYVLHYVHKMDRGGIESLIMNLYRNIDREKIQFHFAVHSKEKGHFDDEIKRLGGELYYFPLRRHEPIEFMKAWQSFWVENYNKYVAFHFHTPTLANIYALKMAKKHGVRKIIVHAHNTHAQKGKLQIIHDIVHKYHRNKISKYATKFYACSTPAAQWVFGEKNLNDIDVELFNNGVDLSKFSYDEKVREKYRRTFDVENQIVIGHVGRFAHAKNHEFLIDIFYEINKLESNSVLFLVGEGELISKIKNRVNQYGLNNNVRFLGIREDISELLMSMDLFLFPSLYEGLPVTLIEAQASGISILASDKIAKEVKLVETLKFMDIEESPKTWANKCIELSRSKREKLDDDIKAAGYDILHSVKIYEKYLESEGY